MHKTWKAYNKHGFWSLRNYKHDAYSLVSTVLMLLKWLISRELLTKGKLLSGRKGRVLEIIQSKGSQLLSQLSVGTPFGGNSQTKGGRQKCFVWKSPSTAPRNLEDRSAASLKTDQIPKLQCWPVKSRGERGGDCLSVRNEHHHDWT